MTHRQTHTVRVDHKTSVVGVVVLFVAVMTGVQPPATANQQPITSEETLPTDPIVVQLAKAIELLKDQIARQQQLVKTASSEGEQKLASDQLRFLRQEQQLLQDLLNQLVGPQFDTRDAAREQQSEHQVEQYQKILDQDQRNPSR